MDESDQIDAKAIRRAERERCALLIETIAAAQPTGSAKAETLIQCAAKHFAAAIRALPENLPTGRDDG